MSDFENAPIENNFEASLVQKLEANASALTMYLDKVPVGSIPSGKVIRVTINPQKGFTKMEDVLVESIDTSAKTMTIQSGGRAQDRYNGDSASPLEHTVGSKVIISDPYGLWDEVKTAINSKADTASPTFTTDVQLPAYADSTARDAAIPTPADGMTVVVNGQLQHYNGTLAQWETADTGTPTPTATESSEGTTELATLAEHATSTTGAKVIQAKNIAKESGDAAEGRVVVLNSNNEVDTAFIPSSIAGASVLSFTAGETIDGTTTPQAVYVSDGSNSRTAGRVYLADADDLTNMATRVRGFVVDSVTAGQTVSVYIGVIPGFTGLTPGVDYFLSSTAGAIDKAITTNPAIKVGWAKSATELKFEPDAPTAQSYVSTDTGVVLDGNNVEVTVTCGFRPKKIFGTFTSTNTTDPAVCWAQWVNGTENNLKAYEQSGVLAFNTGLGSVGEAIFARLDHDFSGTDYWQIQVTAFDDDSFTLRFTARGTTLDNIILSNLIIDG